jgi:hypothetical protein
MTTIRAALLGAAFSMSAGAAMAAPTPLDLTIDSVLGTWHNVIGGENVDESAAGPAASAAVSWGFPANDDDAQSAYIFDGLAPSGPHVSGDEFVVGTFTHDNFTISGGGGITSADLSLEITGSVDGTSFTLTPTYTFTHVETVNNPGSGVCEEGGEVPCPDLVSFALVSGDTSTSFVVGAFKYSVGLIPGFQTADGFVDEFLTEEGIANSADLLAEFEVAPIPVPAALPLFATALGALGVMSRRRRS